MLTQHEIREHYKREDVRNTIMRISTDGNYSRAGMKIKPNAYTDKHTGELKDSTDWFNGVYGFRQVDKKINLSLDNNYVRAINDSRTLYWTLNFFDKAIYDIDYRQLKAEHKTNFGQVSPSISRENTFGYTFGIDIDKDHGQDIHDPEVKQAVEAMAQFFSDKLREFAPNSVYCLYSGGGIYVMLHHRVLDGYFEKFKCSDNWHEMMLILLDALDFLIGSIRDEFFKLYPQYVGKVKPDQLNGSQRVFKTIYSVHKRLDYAVIPLNPEHIEIDFKKASIPLCAEIIEEGNNWYTKFDNGTAFLNMLLKPFLWKAKENREHRGKKAFSNSSNSVGNVEVKVSSVPIEDMSKWSPCMRNLYNLPSCGEGATRAITIFVTYLGQIGVERDKAYQLFNDLVIRWGAIPSNIFESYFRNMNVPLCTTLNSNDRRGFPKGYSVKSLGICKPDSRCMCVTSPYFYADAEANNKRIEKINKYNAKSRFIKPKA